MANEATIVYETDIALQMTVTNATGIEKGALLTLSDPLTAALCTTSGAATAGIAKAEKIASNGITKLAVYRGGVFKVTASGAIVLGDPVQFSGGSNLVISAASLYDTFYAGFSLETVGDGETFLMELRPGKQVF